MKATLLIDFGSTFTKLTAIDLENEEILASAKSPSTADSDITLGYINALVKMERKLNGIPAVLEDRLACSSAAGGLKMSAIGLVPELTAEAAKRAALGAGARVLGTYGHELDSYEICELKESKPDIILLAGGTDGGNKSCIIHNAALIAEALPDVPVIVAGNKKARAEIERIFRRRRMCYRISENVMPQLNTINVEPVRECIRQMYIEKIIEAKGIDKVYKVIDNVLMPTPAAVLKAARILADGSDKEEGIGELLVVDIGGATTDVHSIAVGEPGRPGVTLRGLPEPYAKRSVEGDLGMRVSARSLWEAAGTKRIRKYLPSMDLESKEPDIEERCSRLACHIEMIPRCQEEAEFDEALGAVATDLAITRHAGVLESIYTPTGIIHAQTGKDLQNIKYLIGTGGVLVHSANPDGILRAGLAGEENGPYLKPVSPELWLDGEYIMAALGLLAEKYPNTAVRMLKKNLKEAGGIGDGSAKQKME